ARKRCTIRAAFSRARSRSVSNGIAREHPAGWRAMAVSRGRARTSAKEAEPSKAFASLAAWRAWLGAHPAPSRGIWVRLAKKGAARATLTYAEAVEGALAWGWIDSQKRALDERAWLQRFTPRKAQSPWSKINRDKATALISAGRMEAPGLAEVE